MSKYCPASPRNDYLYYVEGYSHPTTVPEGRNPRWERPATENYKYRTPYQYVHRPTPPTYNQVLYCNPQFTTDSSQGTIPFDYESDDRRLKNYEMHYRSVPFPTRTARCPPNVNPQPIKPTHLPSTQSYIKGPVDTIKNSTTSPTRPQSYCYRYAPNEHYPVPTQVPNDTYSETEENESETMEEESEPESVSSKYEPSAPTKPPITAYRVNNNFKSAGDDQRLGVSMEKILNTYNQNKPGKKIHPQDLETLIHRMKKEPIVDSRYVFKKSRCLDSTYEKATQMLKNAKSKAESMQNINIDTRVLYNKNSPYEEYRRKQYSQLLSDNFPNNIREREIPLGSGITKAAHSIPKTFVKHVNPHSVLKPNTPEVRDSVFVRCSPIPEEQQPEVLDIKSVKKTPDSEQPVKLQKENNEPARHPSNAVYQSQSEKMYLALKDKLPIHHKSRRIPRRRRNSVGIYVCAKALKKFTEDSQITIQKHSASSSTRHVPLNLSISKGGHGNKSAQQLSLGSERKNKNAKEETPSTSQNDPPSPKSRVAVNLNNMISKLDEIENLINSKKEALAHKIESSTSQLTMNVDEGTSTSVRNSVTKILLDKVKKKKRKCPKCEESEIHETDNNNELVRQMLDAAKAAESNKLLSYISTKSAIRSLMSVVSTKLSSNKSSTKYDSTDADVLKSIFKLQNEDAGTSRSQDQTISEDSSYIEKKKKKPKKIFDSTSISEKNDLVKDTTTSTLKVLHKKSMKPSDKTSSIVTVFPASKRLSLDSTDSSSRKKPSRIPRLKKRIKNDDSSSDNNAYAVRPKYTKGKKRGSATNAEDEENHVAKTSVLNSLRSAFCIIVDFLFRYFRNMFII